MILIGLIGGLSLLPQHAEEKTICVSMLNLGFHTTNGAHTVGIQILQMILRRYGFAPQLRASLWAVSPYNHKFVSTNQ
jgi:hypothetical protein